MWLHRTVKRVATVLALLSTMLVAAGCGDGEERPLPAQDVRIATGVPGGVYNPYGKAFAGVINKHSAPLSALARPTEGSVENLKLLQKGDADMAFTLADTAGPALRGEPPFTARVPIVALARLYNDYIQVIARRQSELRDVTDLRGKRVSIGAPNSGTALTARRILRIARFGLRGDRAPKMVTLGLRDSADALAQGRIDAFFWSGGLPSEAIVDLGRKMPIRLLDLPSGTATDLDPNLYTETRIPARDYGFASRVTTVMAANLLVVREDLSDQLAFELTRLLFDYPGELDEVHPEALRLNTRSAIDVYPLGLHPGARAWYRQAPP